MTAFVALLILVPLIDQAVKVVLRRRLRRSSIRLGPIGQVRMVENQIWLRRASRRLNPGAIWILWILAAGALAILCALVPPLGWFCGLLLGGSLSHAIETARRGSICDYVCLRFWPAFNMADVAVTVGACGVLVEVFRTIRATSL